VKDLEFELEPAAELAVEFAAEEPSLEETGNVWGVPQRSVAARSQNAKLKTPNGKHGAGGRNAVSPVVEEHG